MHKQKDGRQDSMEKGFYFDYLKVLERKWGLGWIYRYADVFHCEPIEKTADDFINICNIPVGAYDNLEKAKYEIPDYWTIGEVYERLIEDVSEDSTEAIVDTIMTVYSSWISDAISNYNTDFYYQSREYICQCYTEGEVCA